MALKVGDIDNKLIDELDAMIRAGELATVKGILEKIYYVKIPRAFIVKIANISRRVGYHRNALRLLNPLVRPRKPIHPPASQDESVEYAIGLMRIGVVGEALKILRSVKDQNNPETLFNTALCLMTSWNYAEVIPILKKYLTSAKVSPYQMLVGKINLASAFVNDLKFDSAEEVLKEILSDANEKDHKLIVGYAHQTFAELEVNVGRFKQARKHLEKAQEYLRDSHYRYALYNEQWSAICSLLETKCSAASLKALNRVKQLAATKKVWEVIRDCELYQALITQDTDKLEKIYFGSPYPAFRDRVLRLYKKKLPLSEEFVWAPLQPPKSEKYILDVVEGVDRRSGAKLKKGQLLHQLLQILTSDFYRPFKVEALFSALFENEYYDFNRSAHKVYDLIGRLRTWLKENAVPMEIVNISRTEFRIEFLEPYLLRIKPFHGVRSSDDVFVEKLKNSFSDKSFSCRDVMLVTGMSRATCKRYLREAVNKSELTASGEGQFRRYKVK
jgi:tetratricopeptide (TPR) repeat protein